MAGLYIVEAFVVGAILGIIEMAFVHADEMGMGWFMHGIHALPATIFFTFVSMNAAWAISFIPFSLPGGWIGELVVRLIIAIIAILKIQTAAAIAGRVGERFHHVLIIGTLIFASSYAAPFIAPYISAYLPF